MPSKNWELLANFESFELVTREYTARHGRKPNIRHAREIAAPFSHARSYFRSAHSAEPTVKPLLLYYGVVSLARGVTLMLSRGMREANLALSHGLSAKNWGGVLSGDKPDFSALRIEVNATGSFVELGKATEFKSLLRHGVSEVNVTYMNPPVPVRAEFSLGDILSRLPALQDNYMRWRGDTRCTYLAIETTNDGKCRLRWNKRHRSWVSRQAAEELFRDTAFVLDTETPEHVEFKGPDDVNALPGLTDHPESFNIPSLWLTALYPGGVKLSKICTFFALSYMMGMLVRYYPMQWTALIRGQFADAALPTLEASVKLVEDDFPQVVEDFLKSPPGGA
ncbi:MAG: hypothetical protein IID49_05380 [Proteobacteria bacterium]|nr:hypothetical protein [Pseudomonadota bacterium]